MRIILRTCWLLLLLPIVGVAAEDLPPSPNHHFNDYAGVVSTATAAQLNHKLEDFERRSSSQVVVAVYPEMLTHSSLEDYSHRVFDSWKIGAKGKNNGVLLLVFIKAHRLRIEVGYGLEGALPDALGKQIIEEKIAPHFRKGDYDGGLTAGVDAILQATRGEYKSDGHTANEDTRNKMIGLSLVLILSVLSALRNYGWVVPFIFMAGDTVFNHSARVHHQRRISFWQWRPKNRFWTIFFDGWSSSSSNQSSRSNSSFSGGGGCSGGGGASGSW